MVAKTKAASKANTGNKKPDSKSTAKKQDSVENLIKVKKGEMLYLHPSLLKPGFNPRIEYGDIEELMNSIIQNGVLMPLAGKKEGDKYVLSDGHRRLMAIEKAIEKGHKIENIPFQLEDKTGKERIFGMLARNDGKEWTLAEKGIAYQKLVDEGVKQKDIALRVGKSVAHVNSAITINKTVPEVKAAVAEGKISPSTALEIARNSKTPDDEKELLNKVLNHEEPSKSETPASPFDDALKASNNDDQNAIDALAAAIDQDQNSGAEKKEEPKKEKPKPTIHDVKKAAGKTVNDKFERLNDLLGKTIEAEALDQPFSKRNSELLHKFIRYAEGALNDEDMNEILFVNDEEVPEPKKEQE